MEFTRWPLRETRIRSIERIRNERTLANSTEARWKSPNQTILTLMSFYGATRHELKRKYFLFFIHWNHLKTVKSIFQPYNTKPTYQIEQLMRIGRSSFQSVYRSGKEFQILYLKITVLFRNSSVRYKISRNFIEIRMFELDDFPCEHTWNLVTLNDRSLAREKNSS